jgi:hypothetical protein
LCRVSDAGSDEALHDRAAGVGKAPRHIASVYPDPAIRPQLKMKRTPHGTWPIGRPRSRFGGDLEFELSSLGVPAQWQIETMRRLEIPEDMRKKYGFAALGANMIGATRA